MHDLPRQKLSELLAQHGHGLCDDPKCLEGLLKDMLRNEHKRETFVLVSALREGVAHELRGSTSGMPPAALAAKLVRQLYDNLGMDDDVARWSVESWAVALGVQIPDWQSQIADLNSETSVISNLKSQISNSKSPISNASPSPASTGVDLVALAMQHRAQAKQDQVKAAQAEAHAVQVQKDAKAMAEQTRDFAAAARMIEEIEPQWRDVKLYEKIRGDRDLVTQLDANIQEAVQKGRLRFLRGRVEELLKLQPKRDDMRRRLEVLPNEPELAKEFTNSIGMRFVLIPAGEFMMGSNEADDEKPPHLVRVTRPFYLGVFPVTQAEYQAVTGQNPSNATGNPRHPVEQVSWDDAVACAQNLSQLSAELNRELTYRLPTEAEWEYACRAGSTGKWCCGDQESQLRDYAWFPGDCEGRTNPVGERKPNAWGLYDMHDNVSEWCLDRYDAGYYQSSPTDDPSGPASSLGGCRVFRGGNSYNRAAYGRSAGRHGVDPGQRSLAIGFRLAAVPE